VLSWSYQALTPPAARLFRLLGLHPGADSSAAAAASLAGQPLSEVRPLLAELTRASLLTEPTPGRYTSHDLLRAYAADLRHSTDTDQHRRAAVGRLLDHYLHTADTVNQLLDPTLEPIPLPLTQPVAGTSPEHPADAHQATAWLATEHTTLLAVLCQAADTGHDTHTWQLACTLDSFVARWGHWHDLVTHWQAALDAAGRLGHRVAQAYAHRLLARSHTRLGRYADADTHHRNALALYAQAGDLGGEANTHIDVAISWGRQGRPDQALEHARRALTLYRAAGRRRGPAYALNAIGWFQAQLGDHTQALTHCEQALTLHRELLNRAGEAETWDSLGYVHHHLGHHTQAIDSYQHALDLYRDLGDRYEEAITLTNLGDTHHAAGNPTAARITWQRALDILTSLDHPSAETLRTKLGSGGGLVVRLQPSS
jgi:Tfp pilus assembly protein PilF